MSLTPEQIKSLLAKPVKKRGAGKKGPDTNIRDRATWFALASKTRDEAGEDLRCQNPNCVDPRPPRISALGNEIKHQFVVEVKGELMCRYCFLDGWLLENPAQEKLNV
jgi:hypothetical protein